MGSEALSRIASPDLERDLESFHPSSFGWAMVCCRWNREEAQEVLQTSYLRAIEGRAKSHQACSLVARTGILNLVGPTSVTY